MGWEIMWMPVISWGPFQLPDSTKEHSICMYIGTHLFIKMYTDEGIYINEYYIFTLPDTKHLKCTLLRRSKSPWAALQQQLEHTVATGRSGQNSPRLLPLQFTLKPTGGCLCRRKPCKAPKQDCRFLHRMTPVTSVLEWRRQGETKEEMKEKAQTLCPGRATPAEADARQSNFLLLFSQPLQRVKQSPFCPSSITLLFRASPSKADDMGI